MMVRLEIRLFTSVLLLRGDGNVIFCHILFQGIVVVATLYYCGKGDSESGLLGFGQ